MNCECFYKMKDNKIETARKFAQEFNERKLGYEISADYICKAKKDFTAAMLYEGEGKKQKVNEGDLMVFVSGKYCYMPEMVEGSMRGFPERDFQNEFMMNFGRYIEDLEEV